MRGRFLSIKKTTILRLSFILSMIIYATLTIFTMTTKSIENAWFYYFCILIGLFLITKSCLFRLDSSCYFGCILLFIGSFYFLAISYSIEYLFSVYVLLAFSLSSFSTYIFFNQPFQFYISLSLFFASVLTFIFILGIISLGFFLALIALVVLLLCCSYLLI